MRLSKCLGGVLCFAALVCGQATKQPETQAAPATPVAPARVRVMDMQRAILTCEEGKKSSEALQKRFAARNDDLQRRLAELQDLQKQFTATPANLTDRKAELAATIERKNKSLSRDKDDFTAEVQQAESELIDAIGKKVLKVVDEHARKHGYDLILETSQQGTILWYPKAMDITEEVVAAINQSETPAKKAAASPQDKPASSVAQAPKK